MTARKKGINLGMLEDLYNQRIKVAEAEEKKYRGIVKYFVEDVIVDQMMKTSPDMADLYRETYWGGSVYDGLKVVTGTPTLGKVKYFLGWIHPPRV